MKQFRIPFAVFFSCTLLSMSGCLPKKASSSGGTSGTSTSTSVSGNSGGLGSGLTPTPTPFGTSNVSGNPVIKVQGIIKRQPHTSTPTEAISVWNSTAEPAIGNGAAFTTDKVFKFRVKVNAQPAWSNCGPWTAQSHTGFSYKKLQMKVTVTNDTNGFICSSSFLGPIDVNATSSVVEVSSSCLNQAVKPVVQIDNVTSDTACQSCLSSPWNTQATCSAGFGCPVTLPDPTQCWSVDLEVATSNTVGF